MLTEFLLQRAGALPSLFDVCGSNVNAHTSSDSDDCDQAYGGLPFRNARCRIERVDPPGMAVSADLG